MDNSEKLYNNSWKRSKYLLWATVLATFLNLSNWLDAKANIITDRTKENIEQVISPDIVDNIMQRTGVKLPAWYEEKVRDFVNQCDLLKDAQLAKITEDFIVEKMSKDLWISKENQMVSYLTLCFGLLLGKDLYPWPWEDNNNQMDEDFKKILPILTNDLREYSDITTPRIATLIYTDLDALVQFYNTFKEDSQSVKQSDFDIARQKLRKLIRTCEQFGIDYQKKLSPAQEFYGI